MTVAEIVFYIFISLLAAIGGAYIYLMVRDVIYSLFFKEDSAKNTKENNKTKNEKQKMEAIIIYDECKQCAKESVCKYSSEYHKDCENLKKIETCKTAKLTLKCEEFLSKQPSLSYKAVNNRGGYMAYVNDGKEDVKPYED